MLELWHFTTYDHDDFIEALPAGISEWEAIAATIRRWQLTINYFDRFPTRLDPRHIPESVREDYENLPTTVSQRLRRG